MTDDIAASDHDYETCDDPACADELCLAWRAGAAARGAAAGFARGHAAAGQPAGQEDDN
jgi:hypothetical protein